MPNRYSNKQRACMVISAFCGIAIGHWIVGFPTETEAESVAAMFLILAAALAFYWFGPKGD